MEIIKTGYTRKIDSMGRIGIPIKLRKEYNIEEHLSSGCKPFLLCMG